MSSSTAVTEDASFSLILDAQDMTQNVLSETLLESNYNALSPMLSSPPEKVVVQQLNLDDEPCTSATLQSLNNSLDEEASEFLPQDDVTDAANRILQETLEADYDISSINLLELVKSDEENEEASNVKDDLQQNQEIKCESVNRPAAPPSVSSMKSEDSSSCASPRRISQRRLDNDIAKKAQQIRHETLQEERKLFGMTNSPRESPLPLTPGQSASESNSKSDRNKKDRSSPVRKTRATRNRQRIKDEEMNSGDSSSDEQALNQIKQECDYLQGVVVKLESGIEATENQVNDMTRCFVPLNRLTTEEISKCTQTTASPPTKRRGRPPKSKVIDIRPPPPLEKLPRKSVKKSESKTRSRIMTDSEESSKESDSGLKEENMQKSDESSDEQSKPLVKKISPLKIALKLSTTNEKKDDTKKRKETNVQKLIKARSLPKAQVVSTGVITCGGDRCTVCNLRREKWVDEMATNSLYCSENCVEKMVSKANQVVKSNEERLMVIEKVTGAVLNGPSAPMLSQLHVFLQHNSSYYPVLPEKNESKRIGESWPGVKSGESRKSISHCNVVAPDRKRLEARRVLKEVLVNRANDAEDVLMTENEVRTIAIRIEEELFKVCGNNVSPKYKNWFRSALTQLKSCSNKGLFRRILSGDISASKAASLSPDELASKSLAEWTSANQDLLMDDLQHATVPNKPIAVVKAQESVVEDIFGLLVCDTTAAHKSHLFDLNCKICTGKLPHSDVKEKRKSSQIKSPPKIEQRRSLSSARRPVAPVRPSISPTFTHAPAYVQEEYDEPVDDYTPRSPVAEEMPPLKHDLHTRKQSTIVPTPIAPSPPPVCWQGIVTMQSYFHFPCTTVLLSGSRRADIAHDLPTMLNVVGRIPPRVVWDYLTDIRKTNSKMVFVMYLVPPHDSQERAQYQGLYDNMRKKERFSVLGKNIDPTKIKDCYMFPLAPNETTPDELMISSIPGLPEKREDLVILVVVSQKCAFQEKPKPPPPQPQPIQQDNYDPLAIEYSPDVDKSPVGPRTPQAKSYSPTQVPVGTLARGNHGKSEMRNIIYGGMGLDTDASPQYSRGDSPTMPMMIEGKIVRRKVANLLREIRLGEKEPSQVASLVQQFLGENTLSDEEQQWILEALNACVNQHHRDPSPQPPAPKKWAVTPDQEDQDQPYDPEGPVVSMEDKLDSPVRSHALPVDSEVLLTVGTPVLDENEPVSDAKGSSEFVDWMMQRMVAAMDQPQHPPPRPIPHKPIVEVPVGGEDMDLDDGACSSTVHLPPPPLPPANDPFAPPPQSNALNPFGFPLDHEDRRRSSPASSAHWLRDDEEERNCAPLPPRFPTGAPGPRARGTRFPARGGAPPARDTRPAMRFDGPGEEGWGRGGWQAPRRGHPSRAPQSLMQMHFEPLPARGRGRGRGDWRGSGPPRMERPRVDYGDVDYDQWGHRHIPPMHEVDDLMQYADPEFGVPPERRISPLFRGRHRERSWGRRGHESPRGQRPSESHRGQRPSEPPRHWE